MKTSITARAWLLLAIILPALGCQAYFQHRSQSMKTLIHDDSLIEIVNSWTGTQHDLTDDEKSMLRSPAASQRIYVNPNTDEVVQILLLQVNNTQNAHDPRLCMTGDGYSIVSEVRETVTWANKSRTPSLVSHVDFAKNGQHVQMYYWLQTPNRTIADMSAGFKLEGIKRAMKGEATRGIAVRLICLPKERGSGTTSSEAGIKLWREIDDKLDIERLAKEM